MLVPTATPAHGSPPSPLSYRKLLNSEDFVQSDIRTFRENLAPHPV